MADDDLRGQRCAVHQGRPALDRCPVCARARCVPDAERWQARGCDACDGTLAVASRRRPVTARAVVGAAAACNVAAVFAGAVASQYVEVKYFGYLVPLGVGIGLGATAEAGARGARGWSIRLVAVAYALLGTAYGFRFEPAGVEPGDLTVETLGVYGCAAAGAWLWTVPPKRHRAAAGPESPPASPAASA